MALDPEDPNALRIRLSARREKPPSPGPVRTLMFPLRATPQTPPRARARHFAARASGRTVRPARGGPAGQRRVLVKARVVRMTPGAAKALMTHVRYVERDGVGAAGEEGRFFDRETDTADGRAFAGRCAGDRHHFRIVVNPEDGRELPDLKVYARAYMARVERDMGTSIDWIAGEHHDTGRPHLHLLLRGRRDDGRDLVLPRDYVSHGLRGRAQELATELLGPRLEAGRSSGEALTANRFTPLDRTLIGLAREGRLAMSELAGAGLAETDQALALRRLTHLETEGFITR
ncbi:MAG: type VI secretion protein, partial [Caulobacteraceae bacterium]